METVIAQGAEATLVKKDQLLYKSRVPKNYRHAQIDEKLRKSRTKKEIKGLEKARSLGVAVPTLHPSEDKYTIVMDYIDGKRLRDAAISDNQDVLDYFQTVGKYLGTLHEAGLIHGDLTTSNILIAEKVYFIDFGLSFFSDKIEDFSVDLHVFEEALESTHHEFVESYFSSFLKGYELFEKSKEVLQRLEVVRMRGRNKK